MAIRVLLVAMLVPLACQTSESEIGADDADVDGSGAGDATSDGDAIVGPTDPNCLGVEYAESIPDAGCVTGASCVVRVSGKCVAGAVFMVAYTEYGCACPSGSWQCLQQGSSLALIPCDAGAADAPAD